MAQPEGIVFKWQRWVSTPGSKLLAQMQSSWVGVARKGFPEGAGEQAGSPVNSQDGSGGRQGWEKKSTPDWKKGVNNGCK